MSINETSNKKYIIISSLSLSAIAITYFVYKILKQKLKKKPPPPKKKQSFQIVSLQSASSSDNNKNGNNVISRQADIFISTNNGNGIIKQPSFNNPHQKLYKSRDESFKNQNYYEDNKRIQSSNNIMSLKDFKENKEKEVFSPSKLNTVSVVNMNTSNNYYNQKQKEISANADYLESTLYQIVNEINDPNKSTNIPQDQCGSIYLPINQFDLEEELKLAEAGYMEEDDDDLKSSEVSGGFFGLNEDDDDAIIKLSRKSTKKFDKDVIEGGRADDIKGKNEKEYENDDIEVNRSMNMKNIIGSKEELEKVLFPKSKYEINPNQIYTIKVVFKLFPSEKTESELIESTMFLVILTYLYNELHNGLIELSDNFTDERRKFFNKNMDTYISIVNFYLKSKEELFLGVLSQIMSKLSISQVLLDNSFNYYMNIAEDDDLVIKNIRIAYDKVYKAGEKYSIAPKVITKLKLKNILSFQIDTFTEYSNIYPELANEIIDIMVTDKTYCEYGFDKEAIRSAINKHQISEDPNFEKILVKLEEFKNCSFLNI